MLCSRCSLKRCFFSEKRFTPVTLSCGGTVFTGYINRPVQKMVDAKRGYETQEKNRSVFSEEKKLQDIPLKKV